MVSSAQVVGAARQARATVEEDLARVDSFHHWHQKQRADVDAELAEASRDLGQALLPSFHEKAIERAVSLTGYSPLAHERLGDRVAAEEAQLAGQIAAIEADRRYWDAERDKSLRGVTPAVHTARLAQQKRQFDEFVLLAEHPAAPAPPRSRVRHARVRRRLVEDQPPPGQERGGRNPPAIPRVQR